MKKTIITLLLGIACTLTANAQVTMKDLQAKGFGAANTKANAKKDSVAQQVEENDTVPTFPGGQMFLDAYIAKKVEQVAAKGKGEVVVSFKVDKKGYIYGAEVTKSAGNALDTEAFNIVTSMPKWKPAKKDGIAVEGNAQVTVKF